MKGQWLPDSWIDPNVWVKAFSTMASANLQFGLSMWACAVRTATRK